MCPPAKRQRTENSSRALPDLKKSSDGKVVLLAGNTEFRVHWDVLALHSSVFRDMQRHPPPSEHPDVEGCPVVELLDDPEEVEYLLKVLYTPCVHSLPFCIPLPVIRALIRLGRKYDFKDFCSWAVAQLGFQYPTSLEEFDRSDQIGSFSASRFPSELTDIIALARENKIFAVLPSAYYCAIKLSLVGEGDGPSVISLPTVDLNKCVIGREKLLIQQFKPGYTFGWLQNWEKKNFVSPKLCRTARNKLLAKYFDDAAIEALQEPRMYDDLCDDCGRQAKEYMTVGRRKIWQELPIIFGVGSSWSDL
ncbi:hypothetical protein C8R45DRAFT_809428 [Mycena sanguinolenta]|nr:hypothetical protein C8R45DRAFT_809428 [Mycena sanguinolenta]